MQQAYLAVMGGYALRVPGSDQLFRLDGFQYYTLIKNRIIDAETAVCPTADINDRSKGDSLAKAVTCAQISFLLIQTFGRVGQHLPVTALEVVTLALVMCAIIAYGFWWNKPLSILRPTVIHVPFNHEQIWKILHQYIESPRNNNDEPIDCNSVRFRAWGVNKPTGFYIFNAGLLVLAYKLIHLLAWNFQFATSTEKLLWRIITLISLALALLHVPVYYFVPKARWDQGNFRSFSGPLWIAYILCRAYIYAEIFLSLRAAPAAVYETVAWGLYFPHL